VSPRFSECIGAVKVEIQVGTMYPALRSTIWNFVTELIPGHDPRNRNPGVHQNAVQLITASVLRVPLQRIDYRWPLGWLLEQVEAMTWAEVYDLLQYAVDTAPAWRTA
jgi:hypothetical protein